MSHRPARPRPVTTAPAAPAVPTADPALDEALERISDLAARLWAVRSAHRPVATGWRRSSTRCAGCGQPVPCATLLAAG
jgi:hypothetical protein